MLLKKLLQREVSGICPEIKLEPNYNCSNLPHNACMTYPSLARVIIGLAPRVSLNPHTSMIVSASLSLQLVRAPDMQFMNIDSATESICSYDFSQRGWEPMCDWGGVSS